MITEGILNILAFIPNSLLNSTNGISISIKTFQIIWSIVLRIKSFIPTMGA